MDHIMTDLTHFMGRIGIPDGLMADLLRLRERILRNKDWETLASLADDFYRRLPAGVPCLRDKLDAMAKRADAPSYMVHFLFYSCCAPALLRDYGLRGIGEDVYWDTMRDLREKLVECVKSQKTVGGYAVDWFGGFFAMTRFTLGRLQFELFPFRMPRFERGGHSICRGEPAINIHIPSDGGSLTKEKRMDAYQRARRFFAGCFPTGTVPFVCWSWLLFPRHREFLPPSSNILDFMGDFEILDSYESDGFEEGWRLFFDKAGLPLPQLPRDTSLQRAYIDWMAAGSKTGSGYGIFFFDGERIL